MQAIPRAASRAGTFLQPTVPVTTLAVGSAIVVFGMAAAVGRGEAAGAQEAGGTSAREQLSHDCHCTYGSMTCKTEACPPQA